MRFDARGRGARDADAIRPDARQVPPERLPASLLRFTLPSRYAETDKLLGFAWDTSRRCRPAGRGRARSASGFTATSSTSAASASRTGRRPTRSRAAKASAATARTSWSRCAARSTCRRATRSRTCPTSTSPTTASPWTFTPTPRSGSTAGGRCSIRTISRRARGGVFIAGGLDAADAAFATLYGGARLTRFEVWADRRRRRWRRCGATTGPPASACTPDREHARDDAAAGRARRRAPLLAIAETGIPRTRGRSLPV